MNALLTKLKQWLPQSGLKAAHEQFAAAELCFPAIPKELAARISQQKKWWFSSRQIDVPPYNLDYYTDEFDTAQLADYVLLSHDGHGINSLAIQYYLVQSDLGLFLHLAWGGVYTDNEQAAENIAACIAVADRIVTEAQSRADELKDGPIKVVACDFYGSYWTVDGGIRKNGEDSTPLEVLNAALDWMTSESPGTGRSID